MNHTVTVFRGDGIGPELVDCVLEILGAADAPLDFEVFNVGEAEWKRNGALIPQAAYDSFTRTKVLLKSPITTPVGTGFRSLNVTLRNQYDLYANIRPVKSVKAVKTPFHGVDIVIFRENTEGLYVGEEKQIDPDTVHAIKIVTRTASRRIIQKAFSFARENGRKKVTCVHKANILKQSDGLFLSVFREVAAEYPEIQAEDKIIDNTCMQLVMNPNQFDVMVMQNLYGDLISDLCSGLIGGLGLVPSSNIGQEYAMFEAVHGSAPDIAGKHLANPTAFLWSACMMLDHLGESACANRIRNAVDAVLSEGAHLTRDLHGTASTEEYVSAILAQLRE